MSAFAAIDAAAINAAGVVAFEASGLVESLKTNMASTNADTAIEVSFPHSVIYLKIFLY
jgi:hypothetical protein